MADNVTPPEADSVEIAEPDELDLHDIGSAARETDKTVESKRKYMQFVREGAVDCTTLRLAAQLPREIGNIKKAQFLISFKSQTGYS